MHSIQADQHTINIKKVLEEVVIVEALSLVKQHLTVQQSAYS